MSKYPSWWDVPVTIYNKYSDPTTRIVRWTKTTLPNCFWKNVGSKVMIGETVLDTTSITCRIPEDPRFLEAYKWLQIPNDQKAEYFTLQQDDILIRGDIQDEIDEYTAGQRSTDIIAKYKSNGCITVKDVSIDTMTGMLYPHYHVRGL